MEEVYNVIITFIANLPQVLNCSDQQLERTGNVQMKQFHLNLQNKFIIRLCIFRDAGYKLIFAVEEMKSAIFVQWEQCADDKQNKFVEQLNKKNCTLSPLSSANQTEVTRHQTLQIEKPFHFSIVEKFGSHFKETCKTTFISCKNIIVTFFCHRESVEEKTVFNLAVKM
ncbi:hypothetical protein T07_8349 [Trichinella nelsoni]|uniref:Uncharacterized protein n=1 Tax=Trichinella nelsoni TaxID=6336 RepID=A0A0V0RL75_9BILA|nr:hypothetical protein T07_8349 [Trichinella nelsoni]